MISNFAVKIAGAVALGTLAVGGTVVAVNNTVGTRSRTSAQATGDGASAETKASAGDASAGASAAQGGGQASGGASAGAGGAGVGAGAQQDGPSLHPTPPSLPTVNPTLPTLPTVNPTLPTLPTVNPTLPTLPTVNPTLPTVTVPNLGQLIPALPSGTGPLGLPSYEHGTYSVLVPATPGDYRDVCLSGTLANRCERIVVPATSAVTLTVSYAANTSALAPTFVVNQCNGGLSVTLAGLGSASIVTVTAQGKTISGSTATLPQSQTASVCK